MTLSHFDIRVRRVINRHFVDQGFAPAANALAEDLACDPATIDASLVRLEHDHHLLLYPGSHDIWVAHPFSGTPSGYWVESNGRGWWGNCGFCSLGIAAMLNAPATIYGRFGAERESLAISTSPDCILPVHYRLHIPVPISRWHDNLVYTCGNVHYFDSDDAISGWCERHRVTRGQAIPLPVAWELARGWYGGYLDPGWTPRGNAETGGLLAGCGLGGDFWRLPIA